jgi:hypothetical protein
LTPVLTKVNQRLETRRHPHDTDACLRRGGGTADPVEAEILVNDVLRERARAARPAPVDPAEFDGAILAQRDACRAAGQAWEAASADASLRELAVDVARRQAAMASERAVTPQQAPGQP